MEMRWPFAAGQPFAVFPDQRIITLRKLRGEIVALGEPGRTHDFFVRGVLFTQTNVFHHACVEQRNVLKNDGEVMQQGFGIDG